MEAFDKAPCPPDHADTTAISPSARESRGPFERRAQPVKTLSFETIYAQHFDFVWAMIRRSGVQAEAVADIVQEVFLVVHRKLGTLEEPDALRSWLYSIARRCASGHHMKSKAQRFATSDLEELAEVESGESPADLAERSDKVRQLWQLLDSLEEQKREVFIMAELGEMSCPEIARALSIPLNTAYSRLRHAREAFEAALHRAQAKRL